MENNCAIIVSSCDAFDDLWRPFFTFFFRYWPDCPFPVYLISNYKKYDDPRVKTISVGEDKGWASNMKLALKQIPTSYIICLLEDLFIEKPVKTSHINTLVKYINDEKVAYIRLFPAPLPNSEFPNDLGLGLINKGTSYRVSLQAGLWDKKILDSLLVDGENAWQMEIEGSKRSNNISMPFLSVKKPALYYNQRTAVIRGKWNYGVVKFCKREGVKIDTKKRRIYYAIAIANFFDKARKSSISRKIRNFPVAGFAGIILMKFVRKLLKKY